VSAPTAKATANDGAAGADLATIKAIEAKPRDLRSSTEVFALAGARATVKLRDVQDVRGKLEHDADLAKTRAARDVLFKYASDPDTAQESLRAMVALPGSQGADWLYEMSTASKRPETRDLAAELLESKDVRARASLPLSVALDLKRATSCAEAKPVVERAAANADRRALPALQRMKGRTSCRAGTKPDDCFDCLKEGTALDDAIKAAKGRAGPKG
jgi:hypothetical protein